MFLTYVVAVPTSPGGRMYPNCCYQDGPRSPTPSVTSEDGSSTPSSYRRPGSQLSHPTTSIPFLTLDPSAAIMADTSAVVSKPRTPLPSARPQAVKKADPPKPHNRFADLPLVKITEEELEAIRPGFPRGSFFIKGDPNGVMRGTL
jgi:hypothetical protein